MIKKGVFLLLLHRWVGHKTNLKRLVKPVFEPGEIAALMKSLTTRFLKMAGALGRGRTSPEGGMFFSTPKSGTKQGLGSHDWRSAREGRKSREGLT